MLQPNELKDEVRRVTEAIRNVFHVEGDLEESDLDSLHGQFIECVEAVNQRLRRCDDLLRKGLRGEAIQESEIAPSLLELVTDLDIPEWEAWSDYVRQFSIPPPPDLLVDVAAALNEAYNEAQPLAGLLRLHRLHALARSPLKDRIAILRGIAKRDETNPVWREDLSSYERNRLQQVEQELRQLQQVKNLRGLDELRRELADPAWLVPPTPLIVKRTMTIYEQLRVEAARMRLASIEQEINAAFSEFNVRRAELARDEWDKYAEIAQPAEDDDLFQRVLPAFDWLDQEADNEQRKLDYTRASASLESGLDNDRLTKTDLLRLFNEVERFDETVPDRVKRRYSERVRSLETGELRRGRFMLLASFATLLLLGSITAFTIYWRIRASQVESAATILAKLISDGRTTEAQSFYDRTQAETPFIAAASAMQKLHAELTQAVQQEEGRAQRVRQHLDAARKLAESESSWEKIQDAFEELEAAEGIAKHEHELVAIKTAEGEVRREKTRLENEVDSLFRGDLAIIVAELERLDELDRTELRDLQSRAEQLQIRARVSETVRQGSGIAAIVKKLKDRDTSYELFAARLAALQRVTNAIGSATVYKLALDNYANTLQAGSRVRDFQKVSADEVGFADSVAKWNTLANRWNRMAFNRPEAFANTGASVLKEIKSAHRDFPSASEALAMESYVDSMTRQFSGKPVITQLCELFASSYFQMQYVEVLRDSQKHYFTAQPKRDDDRALVIYALQSVQDENDVKEMSFTKTQLRKFGDKHYSLAPHAIAAGRAVAFLNKDADYEQKICGVLLYLLDDASIDPILKCRLVQEVLKRSLPGSSILSTELADFQRSLDPAGDLSSINWLASGDERVDQKRTVVRNILDGTGDRMKRVYLERIKPQTAKTRDSKPTLPELAWVGILLKADDDDSSWSCKLAKSITQQTGDLLMWHTTGSSSSGHFLKVGYLSQGKVVLSVPKFPNIPEGRPVWVVRPPK